MHPTASILPRRVPPVTSDDSNVKKVQHLNVFLVKSGYQTSAEVVHEDGCQSIADVAIDIATRRGSCQ